MKIGFAISGAASRIAQEMVLLKHLVQGRAFHESQDRPIIPDVISGSSSGALNAVALNAILLGEGLVESGRRDCEFNWESYEERLMGLGNHDVYVGGGVIPEAMKIVRQGAIFDTRPLRELLERMVNNQMKFYRMGDLPIKTYISVVERDTGCVHRLCSQIHTDLAIVDVLMASTSIPVAFPPQHLIVPGSEKPVLCFDGGIGIDGIPVNALREERCEDLYIIRPMAYDPHKPSNRKSHLAHLQIVSTAVRASEYLRESLLSFALCRAVRYAGSTAYCYMPKLSYNYNLLDFACGREQIEETLRWAEDAGNTPLRIKDAFPDLLDDLKPF
jgi:predicted acylesterase/phospholipase RssA